MKIPCENCIVLPICRNENKDLDTINYWVSFKTFEKCSLIRKFNRENIDQKDLIANYLKGSNNENSM